jgi:TonB family protein
MNVRLFTPAVCLFLLACASRAPDYMSGDAVRRERSAAEKAYAKAVAITKSLDGTQLDAPLKAISTPFPDYPQELHAVTGKVRTRFDIEPDGRVSNATVIGSPNAALAALALQAIMRWKFEQPLVGGKPTRISAAHQFVFKLEDDE